MNKVQNVKWCMKQSSLQKSSTQLTAAQISWQSIRVMIRKLWVQTPLGAIFDEIYFVLCNFRSVRLSDRNVYREKPKWAHDFKKTSILFQKQN